MEALFPFEPLLVFSSLAISILIGVILRAKVGFFQKYLIPACIIGGAIVMVLRNIGILPLSHSLLKTFVYHLFNISFISLGLTPSAESEKSEGGLMERVKAPLSMGLVEGIVFPMQLLIGGLITVLFINIGFDLFSTFGFLSPLGFIEGPGQALSIGQTWTEIGGPLFANAATVGLIFATLGFIFAFFVGVPLMNWGIRKGLSTYTPPELPAAFRKGIFSKEEEKETGGRQTTHSANIDSLAFHAALIGLVFMLTYGLVTLLTGLVGPDLTKTLWGFYFFFGLVVALGTREIMKQIDLDYLLDRGLQKRISGLSVDFLITATIAAIQIAIVWKYIVPIFSIALSTGIITLLVVFYLSKRIWSKYNLERMGAIFGTVTGTVPTGLLLVRIADPEFRTPASIDLGIMLLFASPFIVVSMLLVNAPLIWGWSIWFTLLVFAAEMSLAFILLRIFGSWGEPQF